MKKIRINFEKFSDGILIPQFPWPYKNMKDYKFYLFKSLEVWWNLQVIRLLKVQHFSNCLATTIVEA